MTDPPDTDRVERAFELYANTIFRRAMRYVRVPDQANDVVQAVMVKFITKGEHVEEERWLSWFLNVTDRYCIDIYRRNKRWAASETPAELAVGMDAELSEGDVLLQNRILVLLADFSDVPTRTMLARHYIFGETLEEAAKACGVSRRTAYRRAKVFADRVRSVLGEEGPK